MIRYEHAAVNVTHINPLNCPVLAVQKMNISQQCCQATTCVAHLNYAYLNSEALACASATPSVKTLLT